MLSPSDSWTQRQAKIEEYRNNGCRLGWLLDPKNKWVAIDRADRPVEILETPASLSRETILPDFELDLAFLWQE